MECTQNSPTRLRRERLAAARSRSGENNALCCFLTPSRRFATSARELKVSFASSRVAGDVDPYNRQINDRRISLVGECLGAPVSAQM